MTIPKRWTPVNLADLPDTLPREASMRFDPRSRTFDLFPMGSWYSRRNPYWIRLDDCRTPEQLLSWLHHLGEKDWFDGQTCRDFIGLWGEATGCENPARSGRPELGAVL